MGQQHQLGWAPRAALVPGGGPFPTGGVLQHLPLLGTQWACGKGTESRSPGLGRAKAVPAAERELR